MNAVEAPSEQPPAPARSAGPDQFKALLLALVVFGHAYMAPLSDDLTRYLIYSVHMPAFLFLSGYLVRAESLRRRSFLALLGHYWWRMLLAWLAVSLLWRATQLRASGWGWREVVQDLVLEPAFHLWYVPVLMAAIIVAWFAVRTPRPGVVLGVIAALGYLATPAVTEMTGDLPFDSRYTAYFAFFAFGMMVRNGWAPVLPPWWALASLLGGIGLRVLVFSGATPLAQLSKIAVAVGALSLIPVVLRALDRPLPVIGPALVRIGVVSLWLYLLHPFVVFGPFARENLRPDSWWYSLGVTVVVMAVTALVAWVWEGCTATLRSLRAAGTRRHASP